MINRRSLRGNTEAAADDHRLVYNKDIDYIRATLPNVGGITEMVKIMALCETSAVGIVPHFTGPVATAALVHTMATFSARQQRLQPAGRIVNPLVRYLINS